MLVSVILRTMRQTVSSSCVLLFVQSLCGTTKSSVSAGPLPQTTLADLPRGLCRRELHFV